MTSAMRNRTLQFRLPKVSWCFAVAGFLICTPLTFGQAKTPEEAFKTRDADGDSMLSKVEFLASVAKEQLPAATRDFGIIDWDGNGQLSSAEFSTWPKLGDAKKRGVVPDPVAQRAAEKVAIVTQKWKEWDQDGNGSLNLTESVALLAAKLVPGLETSEFNLWDLDGKGAVEQAEATRVIEAAYGIRRLDGFELRSPQGLVFVLMGFLYMDINGDGFLVAEELQQRRKMEPAAAAKFVQDSDQNGDNKISPDEARKFSTNDALAQFLAMDTSLDGACDWNEWKVTMQPWQQIIAWPIFRACDQDGDQKWSFREYRENPQINPMAPWHESRSDKNQDGELQLAEFHWAASPFLVALETEWLKRFDRDHNGSLGLDEFPFNTTRLNGPKAFARMDVDADGKLTKEEAQFGFGYQVRFERLFTMFDSDNDNQLTLVEFRSIPITELRDQRVALPNQWESAVADKEEELAGHWKAWDIDQDGKLNSKEFADAQPGKLVPGLAGTDFKTWDLDKAGQLSPAGVTRVLRVAYGITRPDGGNIQTATGLESNWMQFKALDRNHDLRLDPEEYNRLGQPVDLAKARFAAADSNQDGFLATAEWDHHPTTQHDVIEAFWQLDRDQSGFASPDELVTGAPTWQRSIAPHLFPGFDTDSDGQLSLAEFRRTPLANLQQQWQTPRLDTDSDGYLSLAEFGGNEGLDAASLTAIFFEQLDDSKDGKLDLDEYFFNTSKRDFARELAARDKDKSGEVSLEEFLAKVPEAQKTAFTRDFHVVDWDGNGQLSVAELSTWPSLASPPQRGKVPDPIADRAAEKVASLTKKWKDWDTDGKTGLSSPEFSTLLAAKLIPGLDASKITEWDLDHNGLVEESEAIRVIEAAYGIKRLDGFELRSPRGEIFGLMGFAYWDVNHDDFLVAEEMQQRMGLDPAASSKRVEEFDKNGDKKLSPEEMRTFATADMLGQFLAWDKNFDGYCDWPEWKAAMQPWQQVIGRSVFPISDLDGDRKLSFREFRENPIANLLAAWHQLPYDHSADGEMQAAEFQWLTSPFLVALEAEWFAKLDSDHSGSLGLDEFPFSTVRPNGAKTFVRADLDGDGKLTADELKYGVAAPNTVPTMFQLFDADHDGSFSLAEFRSIPRMESTERRTALANPLMALVQEKERELAAEWKKWDINQDGTLSSQEFDAAQVGKLVPGLAETTFKMWDLEGKGQLSSSEVSRVLNTAYGVTRPDGGRQHLDSGIDTNWMQFKHIDGNHDSRLDPEEHSHLGHPKDKAASYFAAADKDRDGFLSTAEWSEHSVSNFDPIEFFLRLDKNGDGQIDRDELLSSTPAWQLGIAQHIFPGFDSDADGKLTLTEFRLTPLANLQQKWQEPRPDVNDDGYLVLSEFGWNQGLDAVALAAVFFTRLDLSKDGKLDLDEYFFTTSRRNASRDFAGLDKDQNSQLSPDEFVKNVGEAQLKGAHRDFKLFDNDQDGSLVLPEYQQIPSRNGWRDRLAPPDPVIGVADRLKAVVEKALKMADKNSDGKLDTSEFQQATFTRDIPGLEMTLRADWDRDADGAISASDVQRVVDAAMGVTRLDGHHYREPSGILHNNMLYTHADENHDDQISESEYLTRGYGGPDAKTNFTKADSNQDGWLTYQEWSAFPLWNVDPISEFLRYDTDFDGQLTKTELLQGLPEWQHKVGKVAIPAFDDNHDGKLSLAEFRLTPVANMIALWQNTPYDKDADGRLSPSEFYQFPTLELAGLSREYFRRCDLNGDGRLGLDEYAFNMDPARAPADVVFKYRDTNGDDVLTLEELLVDLLAAAKNSSNPGLQIQMTRIEEGFQSADTDGNKQLTMEEFTSDLGKQIFNPNAKPNMASTQIGRGGAATDGFSWRFVILVAVNVGLLGGAAWYILFKGSAPA